MNLAEDKKAPLRSKDLHLKRNMVVQWLSKTAIAPVLSYFLNNLRFWLHNLKAGTSSFMCNCP